MEIKKLLEEFDEEIIKSFLQKNSDYYLAKWKLIASTGSKISWNWAAFALTNLWLGYRKMYLYAFIYILLTLLSVIPLIGIIAGLILWVGIGMYGNYFYGKFTYNKLVELKSTYTDEELFKQQIVKSGGTSIAGVLLVILMSFGIYLLFVLIAYSAFAPEYSYTNF